MVLTVQANVHEHGNSVLSRSHVLACLISIRGYDVRTLDAEREIDMR